MEDISPVYGLWPFFFGGLTDSINPAALATFCVFVMILSLALYQQSLIRSGIFFVLGVLVSVISFGIGAGEVMVDTELLYIVSRVIYILFALFLLVQAWWHLQDRFLWKRNHSLEGFKIPWPLHETAYAQAQPGRTLNKKELLFSGWIWWLGAFLLGFLLASIATTWPQPMYIQTILFALTIQNQQTSVVFSVIIYALAYCLPLVGVLGCFISVHHSARLQEFFLKYMSVVKIVLVAFCLSLSLGLIANFL